MKKINYKALSIFIIAVTSTGCMFQQPDYVQKISALELNEIMQKEDVFLVDVHTPKQQHIKGTDIFIPYNKINNNQDKLPVDKNTTIYLYCKGGPMGNAAAKSLYELGYRNLINLDGGAMAWRKSGFKFE